MEPLVEPGDDAATSHFEIRVTVYATWGKPHADVRVVVRKSSCSDQNDVPASSCDCSPVSLSRPELTGSPACMTRSRQVFVLEEKDLFIRGAQRPCHLVSEFPGRGCKLPCSRKTIVSRRTPTSLVPVLPGKSPLAWSSLIRVFPDVPLRSRCHSACARTDPHDEDGNQCPPLPLSRAAPREVEEEQKHQGAKRNLPGIRGVRTP